MICDKCKQDIDNSKGGFITLSNGKHYHCEWIETITNDNGEEETIVHPACTI